MKSKQHLRLDLVQNKNIFLDLFLSDWKMDSPKSIQNSLGQTTNMATVISYIIDILINKTKPNITIMTITQSICKLEASDFTW